MMHLHLCTEIQTNHLVTSDVKFRDEASKNVQN